MDGYHTKLLKACLEKEPQKYTVPSPVSKVAEILTLKPNVTSIQIYAYPNEYAVILEGENLWFCHEVDLGERETLIRKVNNPEAITGRSIQFNYCEPTGKSDLLLDNSKVKVTLHSHFANPIRRRIPVEQVCYSNYALSY